MKAHFKRSSIDITPQLPPQNAEQPGNVLPKRRIGRQEEIMFIPLLLFFVLSRFVCFGCASHYTVPGPTIS